MRDTSARNIMEDRCNGRGATSIRPVPFGLKYLIRKL